MTFPTLCLLMCWNAGTLDGFKGAVNPLIGCFPELCFLQFSDALVLVGLQKQLINNFELPTWACAAGFNNNNNNNNSNNNNNNNNNNNTKNINFKYNIKFISYLLCNF